MEGFQRKSGRHNWDKSDNRHKPRSPMQKLDKRTLEGSLCRRPARELLSYHVCLTFSGGDGNQ
jgi:hypothetical protein